MMRMDKWFLPGTFVALIILTWVVGNEYAEMNDKLTDLEEENIQLEQTVNKSLKLDEYLEDTPNSSHFNYEEWENASDIAEHFYEDSEGSFQKLWGTFLALEAKNKGVDPFLVYELLKVETGGTFHPETVGPKTNYGHAYGLAQFMENTAPWIAEMGGLEYSGKEDLFDPYFSIQLAITYLDFLYEEYGDWDYALTAYHRGMGGLENYIATNGHAKSNYAVHIQEKASKTSLVALGNK